MASSVEWDLFTSLCKTWTHYLRTRDLSESWHLNRLTFLAKFLLAYDLLFQGCIMGSTGKNHEMTRY